jgi:hypothetical protein
MAKEKATDLEWLEWFYCNADFGPADDDVRRDMKEQFKRETGKALPDGYGDEETES